MLPTVFDKAPALLLEAIDSYRPDWVVSVGQAAGRTAVTPERIAINCDSASIPDNEGNIPLDRPIIQDAPDGYFSLLPVRAMVDAIKAEDLPAAVSNTAGTFVCNHVMYHILHACHTEYPGMKSGFIHVPCIPEQNLEKPDRFGMELSDIVRALMAALRVLTL